jgi:hypothetical protein
MGKSPVGRQVLNAVSENNYQELAKVFTASPTLGPLPGAKAAIQRRSRA